MFTTGSLCRLFIAFFAIWGPLTSFASDTESGVAAPACSDWKPIELKWKNWSVASKDARFVDINAGTSVISIKPRRAKEPDDSHSAMVVSRLQLPAEKFGLKVLYENKKALRGKKSNPWEVLWIYFNYRSIPPSSKKANYVVLKPNGLELGRVWGEMDQEILASRKSPDVRYGQPVELLILRDGGEIRVWVDGKLSLSYSEKNEGSLFSDSAPLALVAEDSHVLVRNVQVCESKRQLISTTKKN